MFEWLKYLLEHASDISVVFVETVIIALGVGGALKWAAYTKETWDKRETYLMSQVAERDKTIVSMTDILLRTNDTLGKLTGTIDANRKEVISELRSMCIELQGKIKDAIIMRIEHKEEDK